MTTKSLDGRWGRSATNSAEDCISAFNASHGKRDGADTLFIRKLKDQLPELDIALVLDTMAEVCQYCRDEPVGTPGEFCKWCAPSNALR